MVTDTDASLEGWGVTLLDKLGCQERSEEDQYQPLYFFCSFWPLLRFQALQQESSGMTVGVLAGKHSGLSCLKKRGGGHDLQRAVASSRDSSVGRGLPLLLSSPIVRQKDFYFSDSLSRSNLGIPTVLFLLIKLASDGVAEVLPPSACLLFG